MFQISSLIHEPWPKWIVGKVTSRAGSVSQKGNSEGATSLHAGPLKMQRHCTPRLTRYGDLVPPMEPRIAWAPRVWPEDQELSFLLADDRATAPAAH
jgi:hypothetical protein